MRTSSILDTVSRLLLLVAVLAASLFVPGANAVAGPASLGANPPSLGPSPAHLVRTTTDGKLANEEMLSTNWSGEAETGQEDGFSSISGSWTVPEVSGAATSFSASWIGIDGFGNITLIQTGTL